MQIFKFAHGLTCVDLVQIHMDRTLQLFDIRRQPLLVLDKVRTSKQARKLQDAQAES